MLASCSVLNARSEDRLHVPRSSQEIHHVATWWSFLGNPSSTCGETLTALPSLISIFSLTSLAKHSVFPGQLTEPVKGADSCTHTLSLVQPHLPVKSSLPSKPFCNSLCKLQYNYIFPPGELCSCLMPLRVVTEISNVSRHLSDHVASRYRKYFRHKAAIQGTRLPKIAIKPYGSKHSQNCFASHRASN